MSYFRSLAPVVVVLALAAIGGWWYMQQPTLVTAPALSASGTLEADETLVAPRVGGAITSLPVEPGQTVTAGQTVATIDDRLIQLQIRQALDPSTLFLLQLQAQDYTLRSPVSGIVTRQPAHPGEQASPGQVLVAVADLATLKLTLYIRQTDLAQVAVGQPITVTADPYPNRVFQGTVTSINQRAEFTPRNVQTQTDRLNLVFGVQATVSNPDRALKPGMPVDARFEVAPPTPSGAPAQ